MDFWHGAHKDAGGNYDSFHSSRSLATPALVDSLIKQSKFDRLMLL